ncbi:MAG: hypothetical protein QOD82_1657, partial [Pseudonocardiales bacterium]|nr:hypothetical protein [Pseudonocardiales bacterium]
FELGAADAYVTGEASPDAHRQDKQCC